MCAKLKVLHMKTWNSEGQEGQRIVYWNFSMFYADSTFSDWITLFDHLYYAMTSSGVGMYAGVWCSKLPTIWLCDFMHGGIDAGKLYDLNAMSQYHSQTKGWFLHFVLEPFKSDGAITWHPFESHTISPPQSAVLCINLDITIFLNNFSGLKLNSHYVKRYIF